MPYVRRETALSLVSALMGELGLAIPTTLVGNTENTVQQLYYLVNRSGQELMMNTGNFSWQFLSRDWVITTVVGQDSYDLPDDLDEITNDSSWNHTTRLPMLGSLAEYEWQMLKARLIAGTTFTTLYRIDQDKLVLYNVPTSAQVLCIPYSSRGWVQSAASSTVYQDSILDDSDVVMYDPQMFKAKLRLLWYETKGFDTTKMQRSFDRIFMAAQASDKPGRTLSLAPGSDYPYLGVINVPDTNYGA